MTVITIVLLTSIFDGRTDRQSRLIRLLVCTDARSLNVVATALGYSHYYIVAVIIIVLLTSILVHGRSDGAGI